MTGVDGAELEARPGWRWDVALSFAEAQRDYVEQVARALIARGLRCFYDADEQIDLWGRYLTEELPAIYGERAAVVVVFVSAEYAARDWTRLERRAALNRAVRERREYVLPVRFDATPLSGLLSDMVAVDLGTRTPRQLAAMIADKLARLAITASALSVEAGDPAREVESAPPAGAVRVREVDPRRLGVHAAISVPGVAEEEPPEYVPRDADDSEFGVRAKVSAAGGRGGFVLLVGGSSVGKTRCAVEAVRDLLPDWWLVHPAGPGNVAALARALTQRTVVWLDELQRYLDGEHGLTGGLVRALLNAPHPAVIIATLWPDRYAAYTALPSPDGADPYAREREVLDLADVVRIAPAFSLAEQDRARAAAVRDPRLRVALGAAGYGLTQTLAAAPQLVACWEDAATANPYAWAVLTAALDAARLGARAPLSADLLRGAAPGYCTSHQQAEAPENWFEQALAYATGKLHGATSALSPAGAGMGRATGFTVADYLIQHASRERRSARVPASTWEAILSHLSDPADAARLADSASNRLLYCYAIPLYRHAADAGDRSAAQRAAELLAQRGDLDEAAQVLRGHAEGGDQLAAFRLAELLAERGDLEEAIQVLRAQAEVGTGSQAAVFLLAKLLAERGDLEEAMQVLRAWGEAGDPEARRRLVELLAERGDLEEAARVLHAWAAAGIGSQTGALQLAGLLAERRDLEEAARVLRAQADTGDQLAAFQLAELLAHRGDLEEAVQVLRTQADTGDHVAALQLAELLAHRGDLEEAVQLLRAQVGTGTGSQAAALQLADLLAEHGDPEEAVQVLRTQAGTGDQFAAFRLAELLAEHGDLEEAAQVLRTQAGTGDQVAVGKLVELLAEHGDLEKAMQVLRDQAEAGTGSQAALQLADLLAERGDLEEAVQVLRTQAGTGNHVAVLQLAEHGNLDEAVQVLRTQAGTGDHVAVLQLAELLAEHGNLDEAVQVLRTLADTGSQAAAVQLAELLAEHGNLEEAVQVLRTRAGTGDGYAAQKLAELLAEHGDLDELYARINAGDWGAGFLLDELLIKQDRGEEAERLHRFGLNPDGSIACA